MLVNLTPHPVVIYAPDTPDVLPWHNEARQLMVIDPQAVPARLSELVNDYSGSAEGIPLLEVEYRTVTEESSLPDPVDGTLYIVSALVALAAQDRGDLVIPYRLVRDDRGMIVGCRALATVVA